MTNKWLHIGYIQAVRSFCKAVMLNPVEKEVWDEDLRWACSVRDRMNSSVPGSAGVTTPKPSSASATVTSIEAGNTSSDSEEASTSTSSSSVVLRTPVVEDESVRRDLNDRQTLLKVPPNYVHLRG